MSEAPLGPPPRLYRALEYAWPYELAAFLAAAPLLGALPRGDGHSVLVLPGFRTSDVHMTTLRRAIRSLGYFVHPWRLGENVGPTERIVDGMSERLRAVHDRTGERASVIGVSLGGLYGRWLARSHPELVRQVITLGSPLQLDHADRTSATALVDEVKATWDSRVWPITVRERERGPLPVPSTAVYTQTDGVIRWPGTIDVADELHENVRVRGSHVGLASSVSAMIAIADRLAQPAGEWRRFRPPPALGALFPPAADGALAC